MAAVRELMDALPGGVGRVVDIRVMGGIDLEVLPDRGLDIGAAWYAGVPLSWTSPIARGAPLDVARDADWLRRFRGGLVTTCGTDHVGPPTESAGLHGRHSSLPATDVRTTRHRDGDATVCRVTGTIEDIEMFGRRIVVHRTIETRTDAPQVVLRDVIENQGHAATPVPLLYHVNLGPPLIHPGSRIHSRCRDVVAREAVASVPDPLLLPEPAADPMEAVFEHRNPQAQAGVAHVVVDSPVSDVAAVVSWSLVSLPRLYQWVWPARRGWALAVEPSNTALFGADRSGPRHGAPMVEAGESITTELTVRLVGRGSGIPGGAE